MTISGNTITVGNLKPVKFNDIEFVNINDAVGGAASRARRFRTARSRRTSQPSKSPAATCSTARLARALPSPSAPNMYTISQAGACTVVYDAGIQSVNLATSGAMSTLTVDGSTVAGWTDNFDFTPTAAGAGTLTVAGSGAGTNFSGLFTYTGIGNGITVNGSTSGFDQLTLTATPGNDTIDAEQTANGPSDSLSARGCAGRPNR